MTVKQEQYTAEEKVEKVLQYLKARRSVSEFCSQYGIAEADFLTWKKEFIRGGRDYLRYGGINTYKYQQRIQYLEAKVERLELDNIALRATIRFLKDNAV